MAERLSNNAQSTVVSGLNNLTTPVTFVVASAAEFPSTGTFRVLVDSELMIVTAVAGTSFTATRAQEGTGLAVHANGSLVTQVMTLAGLDQYIRDVVGITDTGSNALLTIGHITITGIGSGSALLINDTTNALGANIALTGNGATTPAKFIRAAAGILEIMSSAYVSILKLSDAGVLTLGAPGGAATALRMAGTGTGSVFVIEDAANASGANISLTGNGGATPAKFIRAVSGTLEIMSAAYATILRVSDAGVLSLIDTTLKTVSFGANDSGGAGFKLMRIPN